MSRLHLATPDDLPRLDGMVAQYHALEGIESDEEHRRTALMPLLEGSPHGAVWLIGPRMSPVGYVAISFGWSIELGGMESFIDEIWLRDAVRGRGMGGEALGELLKTLDEVGIKALHLEVSEGNPAERLYRRLGFRRRDFALMTRMA
ncbi:GNAT family N-acetyltransferase [Alphaproteobacteria bacterium GH1-50]|uniref:GNAT family N-acetyltransferase n=1 Tax=Kangsaoukella pontilimi TaxID=2691042 RepID=A0A7C9MWD8_9RHOB|nr:GNAT family N-acetyltransferase [Kangsaoukella pontilimi]MXQ07554.1 GNAT family N-acetyltransferase [Kangsaoukella pontilimi]